MDNADTPHDASRTRMHRLLDAVLRERVGVDLGEWVTARRDQGHAWRMVARELSEVTGVSVSHQTLRHWGFAPAESDQ